MKKGIRIGKSKGLGINFIIYSHHMYNQRQTQSHNFFNRKQKDTPKLNLETLKKSTDIYLT